MRSLTRLSVINRSIKQPIGHSIDQHSFTTVQQ